MQRILEMAITFLVLLFMAFGLAYFIANTIDKIERASCYKWQSYEGTYPLYETHPDTVQRCIMLGVNVHADY